MLRLEWNALRQGDRVLVHDADDPQLRLLAGVVARVRQTAGSNEVSIRVVKSTGASLIQPQRLAVHHDPVGFDGQCWRCAGPQPATRTPTRSDRRGG